MPQALPLMLLLLLLCKVRPGSRWVPHAACRVRTRAVSHTARLFHNVWAPGACLWCHDDERRTCGACRFTRARARAWRLEQAP